MKYSPSEYAKYLLSLHFLPITEQKANIRKYAKMIEKNGDLKDWKKIVETYESIREKKADRKTAKVSYAGEINKEKIREHLKNFEVEFNENQSLIGGMQIQIGDLRIDNSITGRLVEIKSVLNK